MLPPNTGSAFFLWKRE